MYKPPADIQKAAKVRKTAIAKAILPTTAAIRKWLQEITNKIKLLTNVTIEDVNIMKQLETLSLHENIESDLEGKLLYSY